MNTTHLLYLHGFRSSPQSAKARTMAAYTARHHPGVVWACPQLPPSPTAAAALMLEITAHWPHDGRMAVVGSSLGGFYAMWLAVQRQCRAVLLNPAVDPARSLRTCIGQHSAWHDPATRFYFRPEYIDELRPLYTHDPLPQPQCFLSIIAQGDEVLDWREAYARCRGTQLRIQPGGDHGLSDFAQTHLGAVAQFLQLAR